MPYFLGESCYNKQYPATFLQDLHHFVMEDYFINYASLDQQRWMISDRTRTDAFAKAIEELVLPGISEYCR